MGYFAIGDIHGCLEKLNHLLKFWNPDNQMLICLGDLVDKGPDSLGVVRRLLVLKEKYGAKIIMGNHDEMFLNWIEDFELESPSYINSGGAVTIDSFIERNASYRFTPKHLVEKIVTNYEKEISFLKELLPYYESDKYAFVHAGVDLNLANWRNSSENALRALRNPFIYGKNENDKIFVFGHTMTRDIHKDKSDDVWFSSCGTKIGIDGGAVSNGKLHGLLIDNESYKIYSA